MKIDFFSRETKMRLEMLRDQFAAEALKSLILLREPTIKSSNAYENRQALVAEAYAFADEMLKFRAKKNYTLSKDDIISYPTEPEQQTTVSER